MPPVRWRHVRAPRRIERIEDAAARLWRLAADEQHRFAIAVVDEAMRNACSGRERGEVAAAHPVKMAVDPCIHFPVDDIDEFFLVLLCVRPGRAHARRQTLNVDSDALKSGLLAQ